MKKSALTIAAVAGLAALPIWSYLQNDTSSKLDGLVTQKPTAAEQVQTNVLQPVKFVSDVEGVFTEKNTSAQGGHDNCESCTAAHEKASRENVAEQNGSNPTIAMPLDKVWEESVFRGGEGQEIEFTLPDGKNFKGVVELAQYDGERLRSVNGKTSSPSKGGFYFVRNDIEGAAGPYSGFVRISGSQQGYKVAYNQETRIAQLEAAGMDEIVCHGYKAIPKSKGVGAAVPATSNRAEIIKLESLPGATGVLYLDFDGEAGPFPGWGEDGGVGDFDAEAPEVTDASVRDVWERVSEDYAPFNINVTTDLAVYQAAPVTSRMQIILTPTNDAAPDAGGVAYLNAFNSAEPKKVCWSFYATGKEAAEVVSHEFGHTFGMRHDGTTNPPAEYYDGHGVGAVGWAPIMGVGYEKELVQWSKGEYANPTRSNEDDIQMIARANRVGMRIDDHGNNATTATVVTLSGAGDTAAVSQKGIIHLQTDVDVFALNLGSGSLSLQCVPFENGANLDVLMELKNAAGTVVASSNPDTALNATIEQTVAAGVYYLEISGVGRGNPLQDGYTDYGSIGQYTLTGTAPIGGGGGGGGGSDDHGNTFARATNLTAPGGGDGNLEIAGDVDFFRFTVTTAGIYTIDSSGVTDVAGVLYNGTYNQIASDDDSAGNRNFRLRRELTPGTYYFRVKASNGIATGAYSLSLLATTARIPIINVNAIAGTVISSGDAAPTVQKGNHFGIILPYGSTQRSFRVFNSGTADLVMNGNPVISITGAAAGEFRLTAIPRAVVAPSSGVAFTVAYNPRSIGVHTATVVIRSNDPARLTYSFTIRGGADPILGGFASAIAVNAGQVLAGSIDSMGEADVYKIVVPSSSNYVIGTEGSIDTFGQLYTSAGSLLASNDDGGTAGNFRIVRTLAAGTYYARVTGRTSTTTGQYQFSARIETMVPDIEVVGLSNMTISNLDATPSLVDGTDFGSLNALSGYVERTFIIKNVGLAPLELNGVPSVEISGTGANHFTVVQLPSRTIESASQTAFKVRFNPAFSGTHFATIRIRNNDMSASRMAFSVKGVGVGLSDDHEGSFVGATVMPILDDMNGVLERGGDVDRFKITVEYAGTYVIQTTGSTDTTGVLYNAAYSQLATDTDSGNGANFLIRRALTPGTYYIQVRGFNSTTTGPYVLSVARP